MTASIIPGVNLLLLNVPPPTETDNVTPRDDLLALKVWYSLTPNFNEITQGTLAYEGPGLSATIAGLTPNVNYYVKYALISDIDPSVYDISDQLVAQAIALEEVVDTTPPPTPTNVVLSAGINTILISHDIPSYTQGHGHRRTLVFGKVRNTGSPVPTYNDVDVRVVTEFTGSITSFASEPGTTWHFWLKWLTNDGVLSTIASGGINGHTATTGQDVTKLLQILNGGITESQLYPTLTSRINLIDDPTTGLVNKIQTLSTTVAGPDGATAQYTVKTDVNGNVAGFGLSNTVNTAGASTSEFVIVADKFAIAAVNTDNTLSDGSPFFHRTSPTTINGVTVPAGTYMKAAFIHDASITNAKIVNLNADKITAGFISADRIAAGSIVADKINSNGLSIKDIAGNVILSAGATIAASTFNFPGTVSNVPAGLQNSSISLSANGTLNGAGGGSVTIPGLGTTGSFGGGQIAINTDFLVSTANIPYGFGHYNNGGTPTTFLVASGGAIGNANYWRMTTTSSTPATTQFGFSFSAVTLFGGWKANTNYIVSFFARSSNISGSDFYSAWNNQPPTNTPIVNPGITSTWQRYVWLINFGTSTIDPSGFWSINQGNLPSGSQLEFSCVQVEVGQAVSGWSAAPWVDESGKIQGTNAGAGTAVANANISISSSGALSGAGGGSVTIGGLGYTGALDANKTSVDANGLIQGVSSGAGTAVANSLITASSINALASNAASTLSSTISVNAVSGAGFRAGNLTWDSAGNRTSGSGVAMTPGGLVGVNSDGTTTFAINAGTGNATFSGVAQSSDGLFKIDFANKFISITV